MAVIGAGLRLDRLGRRNHGPSQRQGPGEVLGFHIGHELIAGRGAGQVAHLLGDADPPLRPVVTALGRAARRRPAGSGLLVFETRSAVRAR
jgi:hypothetical protein